MFDIITIGSATLDIYVKAKNETVKHKKNNHEHLDVAYHLGEKILIENLFVSTGGGGTNTAVAFSRLGLRTGFIGVVGFDSNGEHIAAELKKENIEFLGTAKKGASGISIILPGENNRTILAYKGVNDSLSYENIPKQLETKWLYVSAMMGESFKAVEKLAVEMKNRDAKLAFNPSLYLAKHGLKNLRKILFLTDVLILNKEEAHALTGKQHQKEMLEALMHHIDVNGLVVITNGKDKIYALSGREFYTKAPKKFKVLDATGAGDAFAAGFVYGIMQGHGVQQALDYGCRESYSVLYAIGAKNNLLRRL
jgi:ribokinase